MTSTTRNRENPRSMSDPHRRLLCDSAFFAESQAGAAELKLAYAFEQALDVAVLIGDPGLGKTTLLRRFASRVEATGDTVIDVFYPQLGADGLLAFIAGELDGEPTSSGRREDWIRRIANRVRRTAEQGCGLVIVVDDAHLMADAATLESLQLLLNLRERENARLTLVMAGQRSLIANLNRVPALAQRIGVTATLLPLSRTETASYARHFLRAMRHAEVTIDDDAALALHEMTGGVPRAVNRLCEMAIVVAAADGASTIRRADVQTVAGELPRFGCDAA
ncbi:MAG: AAA family ATPase [Planctomycetaceae bacterium]|nr:AAA family ATPase [Planctomycetaceae bacterium]